MALSLAARAAMAPVLARLGDRYEAGWYDDTRARWLAGRCPCCAAELTEWEWLGVVTEPAAVAEGVTLCGRCIGQGHEGPPDALLLLLAALLP
jgi:hypothetical protein